MHSCRGRGRGREEEAPPPQFFHIQFNCLVLRPAPPSGPAAPNNWARENGRYWDVRPRDRAAEERGYTDDLGNLFDDDEHWYGEDDDEYYNLPTSMAH